MLYKNLMAHFIYYFKLYSEMFIIKTPAKTPLRLDQIRLD